LVEINAQFEENAVSARESRINQFYIDTTIYRKKVIIRERSDFFLSNKSYTSRCKFQRRRISPVMTFRSGGTLHVASIASVRRLLMHAHIRTSRHKARGHARELYRISKSPFSINM